MATRKLKTDLERQVYAWMQTNASDYEGPTQLVGGANAAIEGIDSWLDDDIHDVWEWALDFYPWDDDERKDRRKEERVFGRLL